VTERSGGVTMRLDEGERNQVAGSSLIKHLYPIHTVPNLVHIQPKTLFVSIVFTSHKRL
jgi:hypothetical protein